MTQSLYTLLSFLHTEEYEEAIKVAQQLGTLELSVDGEVSLTD